MASKRAKLDKLPENVALNADQQKEFSQKVTQLKQKDKGDAPGVIYIGHIPRGFFEPQMKEYFSQFGKVSKLRLARSKKTGNQKGYAFVEFQSQAVAKIVADTMHNYLMFHRLLKCQLLPTEKIHPELFKGANRHFRKPKSHAIAIQRHNSINKKTASEALHLTKKRKAKSLGKLADMGIDFEFPGLVKIVGKDQLTLDAEKTEVEKTVLETQEALVEEAMRVLHGNDDSIESSDDQISEPEPKKSKTVNAVTKASPKPSQKLGKGGKAAKLLKGKDNKKSGVSKKVIAKSKPSKVIKQPAGKAKAKGVKAKAKGGKKK